MAKISYKIPNDLDKNYLDIEIALQADNGLGAKPLALKVIFFYIMSGMIAFYILSKTFMTAAPFIFKIVFVILWLAMTLLLAKYGPTKEMQAQMIVPFLNYIPKKSRHMILRNDQKATSFWTLVGIEGINPDTGLVKYTDGTYAYFYRVVGAASILLFDDDRDAIIDRVDSFYRRIGTDVEIISITNKEAQKVYHQIANLQDRYDNLQVKDPELLACMEEQFDVLSNYVGGEFRSIHQYWILKADNLEALKAAKSVLQGEVESDTRIFKQCVPLYEDDIYTVLSPLYKTV